LPSCLQNLCVLNFDGGEGGLLSGCGPYSWMLPWVALRIFYGTLLRFRRLKVFSFSPFPAVVTFQVSVFMSYVLCILFSNITCINQFSCHTTMYTKSHTNFCSITFRHLLMPSSGSQSSVIITTSRDWFHKWHSVTASTY